jgi:hypothetical protein
VGEISSLFFGIKVHFGARAAASLSEYGLGILVSEHRLGSRAFSAKGDHHHHEF